MKRTEAAVLVLLLLFVCRPAVPEDEWLSRDKAFHFITAFSATLWSYSYFRYQRGGDMRDSLRISCAVTLTFSIGKELKDMASGMKFKTNRFSYKDLVFDVLGTAAAAALIYSLDISGRKGK